MNQKFTEPTPLMPLPRLHLDCVDSTMSVARQLIDSTTALPDMFIIDADEQTAGRGQKGNVWESERGQNLQFSIVCHPVRLKANEQFVISQAIAIAVANSVGGEVKWPNDIYVGDRKISGTLIECDLCGSYVQTCIIGTGINVNQTSFHSDAPNPVSMRQISGTEHDREKLLADVVQRFVQLYQNIEQGQTEKLRQTYRSMLYRRTGLHPYVDRTGPLLAAIHDIQPSGHLILRTSDGQLRRYEFKEVKFII